MDENDDDDLSEKLTPEGNDAVEQCPFCGRLNNPGACDACEHYFGSYWDGEMMWSEIFQRFETEWSKLGYLALELETSLGKSWKQLLRLAKPDKDVAKLAQFEPNDVSATCALMEIVDLTLGPKMETDGMLSGGGYSVYAENTVIITKFISAVSKVRERLEGLRP